MATRPAPNASASPAAQPAADPAADTRRALPRLPHDALQVLLALALAASQRPRTQLLGLLVALGWTDETDRRHSQDSVRAALATLAADSWVVEASQRSGFWQVHPLVAGTVYAHLLAQHPVPALQAALLRAEHLGSAGTPGYEHFPTVESAVALTRLSAFGGAPPAELERLRQRCGWGLNWEHVHTHAVLDLVDGPLYARLHPAVAADLLAQELAHLNLHGLARTALPLAELAAALLARADAVAQARVALPEATAAAPTPMLDLAALRVAWAEHLLLADRHAEIAPVLAPLVAQHAHWAPVALSYAAAAAMRQARWAEAQAGFEATLAQIKAAGGPRKGALPLHLGTAYVLALMAQGQPAQWQAALKFCLAESGKRSAVPDSPWGLMALALQMRLGEARREAAPFNPHSRAPYVMALDLWRWLMRAWLFDRNEVTPPPVAASTPAITPAASPAPGLPRGGLDHETARRMLAELMAQREALIEQRNQSPAELSMPPAASTTPADAHTHTHAAADAHLSPAELAAARGLRARLTSAGQGWLVAQLDAALAVLRGEAAPEWFFVPPPAAGWEAALAALAAIGEAPAGPGAGGGVSAGPDTRLWWVLEVGELGALRAITPLEQKLGPRGWGKAKAVPLARLAKAETLPAWDAAVARCIRVNTFDRSQRLDLAAAAVALIGHPLAAWDDAPERAVAIVEASPELEVVDTGEQLQVRLWPAPRPVDDAVAIDDSRSTWRPGQPSVAELKEAEALRGLTLLRDEPQRARLIRYSAAQKRVAQLVGRGLSVPKAAAAQLQPVLQGLGAHFQIHADTLTASREVEADARLRAELTPEGDGVTLRLVVAPFGSDGPRLSPGHGRTRLIASVAGETLGVMRDLDAERSHLETVLDACPMLAPLPAARHADQLVPAVWTLEQADAALALVERLHTLNAVAALDWPKGKAIRVDTVGIGQLSVQVKSGNEWLALQGGIRMDEQLILSLGQLLDWSADSKSRFVPLGEGRYLALTEELRARMADLAAVAEPTPAKAGSLTGGVRLAPVAAAWLDSTLGGAQVQSDGAFQDRLETLVRAQHWAPKLPATLQAHLRPYQEEGYQWAMRLAEAGLGAVLADDMGLGKTLQALAVLLERASGGPALVVAPTSLVGNWQAEARRFAPTLQVSVYAEGDAAGNRDALITAAGPGDVLLVSYQLQQLNAEAFAGKAWHTLVLDEAQAIKNAAAKRSQAAFELSAGFRLALSGTPIENRLAELWSIMRVCNPGLLGTPAQFNSRFAVPIERDRHRGAMRTLKRLIAPFILRRLKAEVLDDLPPRTELTLHVKGNETEQAHYEALRRQAVRDAERAMEGDAPGQAHLNVLAQLTRLRRAACDPRLVTPELKQPGAKVVAFGELAAELAANGHKALVFSQFVDFLALLREPLEAAGIAYQYLDGSTPAAERTRRVAAFQAGEGDLFLISLKAGGFGLNLTVADYVVIADPWWNPAAEDQASGRAHRIGQQRPVTVYRLVNSGTLEEKIVALHADKRELADGVLAAEADAATPTGSGGAVFKVDELMALMGG